MNGRSLTADDVRVLVHNGNCASSMFKDFLDFLRLNGTELPMQDSDIAEAIAAGLDAYASDHLTGEDADTIDQLARDMEVIAEQLHFVEDDDADSDE